LEEVKISSNSLIKFTNSLIIMIDDILDLQLIYQEESIQFED